MEPNNSSQPAPNQPWSPNGANPPIDPATPPTPVLPGTSSAPTGPADPTNATGAQTPVAPAGPSAQWQAPSAGAPSMPSMMGAGSSDQKAKKNKMLMMIIIGVAVLLVAVAVVLYFVMKPDTNAANSAANNSTNSSSEAKAAVALSTLNSASLLPPTDLTGFNADTGTGTSHIYTTTGSTSDKYCSFNLGVYTVAQVPGTDLNGIVNPQLATLRQAGATIVGPNAGTALVLKDSTTSSKTYSVPTLNFDISKDAKHETDHYSVAVLGNTDRAIVVASCANKNGAIDTAGLAKVDAKVKEITVAAK